MHENAIISNAFHVKSTQKKDISNLIPSESNEFS
jgi:hypothetical protein